LSLNELKGDLLHTYEVIRRGEEIKEVIVPLTGEQPKRRKEPPAVESDPIVIPAPAEPVAPPPGAPNVEPATPDVVVGREARTPIPLD
jgi:hypothetical protein